MNLNIAENKEISAELKRIKMKYENEDYYNEDESFNIFGKIIQEGIKEGTLGNKPHREQPRNIYQILEIKKETKGIELKRKLEKVLKNIKNALQKNTIEENTYAYKVVSEPLELKTIQRVSLNAEDEIERFYKIKIPKGTNIIAFSNIIFFNNNNMTLPLGMNLSSNILIDLNELNLIDVGKKKINKVQFINPEDDFTEIKIKHILINELEVKSDIS